MRTPLMTAVRLLPALALVTGVLAVSPGDPAAGAPPRPTCHGERATILGTPGDDVLRGTPGRDVIVARAGDDVVRALGGDDLVCGGDGADRIAGGSGDDRLYGQRDALRSDRGGTYRGPDVLDGGAGDDLLDVGADRRPVDQDGPSGIVTYAAARAAVRVDLGGAGLGTARGAGRDRIVVVRAGRCAAAPCFGMVVEGSPYDDTLLGSAGSDYLVGGWGDDRLEGRAGDDELIGEGEGRRAVGTDADTVRGGAGADRLIGRFGRDVIDGGEGDDQVGSFASVAAQVHGGPGDDDVFTTVTRPGFVLDGGEGHDTSYLARPERDRSTEPGPVLVVAMAPGTVTREGRVLGTVAGLEEVALDDHLRWRYLGTDARDVVVGGYYQPLRAETFGGDDEVTGSGRGDRIDAGDGVDAVHGLEGTDTCLNAEAVDGCEIRSRALRP